MIKYNASSVPVLQLSINSKTLSEQELYDYGQNFIRTQLATVQGASIPLPYGGKARQIMVDLDPDALYAKHLSATDISNALNLQNLILPAGTAKVGDREYLVRVNSSPELVQALNDLPVKTVNGATVYIKDVGQVRDGFAVQSNIVRENGARAALLTVLKTGTASTLDIVNNVKKALPRILAGLPPELHVTTLLDQSLFVRAAVEGVVREALIAGGPDRVDDPAVPGKLAQHADHLYLDSALDSDVAHHPEPVRRNDQRDDAGRPGAGGRHPGGRRHGRNREHPPQPG